MYSVIGADGQLYGPVPIDTLKSWCQQGRVIATTTLMQAGSNAVLRASDLRELHPYLPANARGPSQQGGPQPTITIQQGNQQQNHQQQVNQGGNPYVSKQPYNPSAPHQQNPYQNPATGFQHGHPQAGPTPFSSPYYRGQSGASGVVSQKNKVVAAVIAFLLGGLGIHRFYLGYVREGVIMFIMGAIGFVICPIFSFASWIWAFIDFVKILTGGLPDANGYPLA